MDIIGKVCVIRAATAGAFFGEVVAIDGDRVELKCSRRLWYWEGAASLSQLANEGVKHPESCKFPAAVDGHLVFGVIEIIPATEAAIESIRAVPEWRK